MAKIVFGMAVPHSGMLTLAPENWLEDGNRDRTKSELWFHNKTWTFDEVAAERKSENIEKYLTLEERTARVERNTAALQKLRDAYEAAQIDVAIILGKDQNEVFVDLTPSFAVYSGKDLPNGPPQRSVYAPAEPVVYQNEPELALHLIRSLEKAGFDLADLKNWPPHTWLGNASVVPHAYGFVLHQIMLDDAPPSVPILINTFFPPTQPSMTRCIAFGEALVDAIENWPADVRVGIIASGGLSHFVCDEQLDRTLLQYLGAGDLDALEKIDDRTYQSGTSEVKLYASVVVAMKRIGATMTLVDYVPSYRTEAGTGEGMGFMYWAKDGSAA